MASEPSEGRTVSVVVPPPLEEWLSERAAGSGMDREELLLALLSAYRDATTDEDAVESLVEARVVPLVNHRLDQYDEDVERKLDDVRRRVVQLKKETDTKVPEEQFASLGAQVDELGATVRDLRDDVESLGREGPAVEDADLEAVRESLQAHAETAVRLDERLDDVETKLTRVAHAVVALREERTPTEGAAEAEATTTQRPTPVAAREATLVDIKRQAARERIASADCGACGAPVDLSLLPEAACPHCSAPFGGLEGRNGMFSSPRLVGPGGVSDE
jgi:outer membrane murein-binding lipoprotein Lpp